MSNELIKQWGENTAYAAKNHFKSADLKRIGIKSLIIINIVFAVFSLLEMPYPTLVKIMSIISLIASILILVNESHEDKNTVYNHMKIGDEYLSIHYELQKLHHRGVVTKEELDAVEKRINRLNSKEKPIVNQIAKKFAKKRIENDGEMNKWWE